MPDYLDHWHAIANECKIAAIAYAEMGWSVLQLCPPSHIGVGKSHAKQCQSPGKCPLGKWKEAQEKPATPKQLSDAWTKNPLCNVGIALGSVSGIIGVDIDGAEGETLLSQLSHGDLPPTLEFSTPGGGRRLLYRIPPQAHIVTRTIPGTQPHQEVKILSHGSQTVAPPSLHKNDGRYQWKPGHAPGEIDIADAPHWTFIEQPIPPKPSLNGHAPHRITEGTRDNTLFKMACAMRNKGMSEQAILAGLLAENQLNCQPPLDPDQVSKIARSAAKYAPEPQLTLPDKKERALARTHCSQCLPRHRRRLPPCRRTAYRG